MWNNRNQNEALAGAKLGVGLAGLVVALFGRWPLYLLAGWLIYEFVKSR